MGIMRMRNSEFGVRNERRRRPKQDSAFRVPHSALRGSFSLEYAVLVAVVVAALIGMSIYMKRALQGKWRAVGDTFGHGKQYKAP